MGEFLMIDIPTVSKEEKTADLIVKFFGTNYIRIYCGACGWEYEADENGDLTPIKHCPKCGVKIRM